MIYSFMYGPQRKTGCPMCTSQMSAWDGIAPHVRQRAAFAMTARSPIKRIPSQLLAVALAMFATPALIHAQDVSARRVAPPDLALSDVRKKKGIPNDTLNRKWTTRAPRGLPHQQQQSQRTAPGLRARRPWTSNAMEIRHDFDGQDARHDGF